MARPRGLRISRPAFTDLRLSKHLSLSDVAGLAGMKLTTLSGLVNGDHGASMRTVRQLADALNCSPATLFPELLGTPGEDLAAPEAVA